MRRRCFNATEEDMGFLVEALQAACEEAMEVLDRHRSEEPPLFNMQTIGEAAEDYGNLVQTQQRRAKALEYLLMTFKADG